MTGASSGPEMDLIHDSVAAANARIRFFRIAYGSANDAQMMAAGDIRSILDDITRGGRISINWQPSTDLARNEVQLAFLAIQCAEQALAYGGDIQVAHTEGTWRIFITGERLMLSAAQWDLLSGDTQDDEAATMPAHVQFLLLPSFAQHLSRSVQVEQISPSEARLTIAP